MNIPNKQATALHRAFSISIIMLVTAIGMTSCLKDDDNETTLSNDAAITSFTLGTMNRYVHTTSSTGADSIYKKTYVGSNYAMMIDQYGGTITNAKPLPVGTDVAHVVCTISSGYGSVIAIIDTESNTPMSYSSSDSIDFSQPREIRAYAQDGSTYKAYTVSLTVSQDDSEEFLWTATDLASVPTAARTAAQYAVTQKDESTFLLSADGGATWTEQPIATGEDSSRLPADVVGYTSWTTNSLSGATYELLVGNSLGTTTASAVWRRQNAQTAAWVEMTQATNNPYYLPKASSISLAYWGDRVIAVVDGQTIYESRDQGITWKQSQTIALPTEATAQGGRLTIGTAEGSLWLTDQETGRAWRGK